MWDLSNVVFTGTPVQNTHTHTGLIGSICNVNKDIQQKDEKLVEC